ncbi:pilus assembly protein CpaB [Litorivivens lipolytica]|uniref:Pilus assembly protein CpaB n=1 Tax=Litorivivens lipolytica TaxID=1524264 RepID=A0A7W4Z515_9GAMM|nr:Flp pilus assembly protein CpaB [Litorivivens lipolytica]MBB3046728.1 pilus assembly protein CpaB [Litorivivens lipolytica]
MQPKTLKILAFGLIGFSLILAIVGIRLSSQPEVKSTVLAPESAYKVVVTKRAIEPNTVLSADDVQSIPYPLSTGGTFTETSAVVGKEVYVALPQGEVLREQHFEISSVLAEQVKPGYRAMAVAVDETIGTGGYLMPGDKVDILFATRASRESGNSSLSRRILTDITVLAFGNVLQGTPPADEATGKRSRTAVLEVPEADISKLLLAETAGSLRLAAVGDRELEQMELETTPAERAEIKADMADVIGKPKQVYKPRPKVYVYHGDSVETVRTNP